MVVILPAIRLRAFENQTATWFQQEILVVDKKKSSLPSAWGTNSSPGSFNGTKVVLSPDSIMILKGSIGGFESRLPNLQ